MEAEKDKQVSDNGTSFSAMGDYQKLNAITPDIRAKRILNEAAADLTAFQIAPYSDSVEARFKQIYTKRRMLTATIGK